MRDKRDNNQLAITLPATVLEWLGKHPQIAAGQIYGDSLKYIMPQLSVLKIYLPDETIKIFQALRPGSHSGDQAHNKADDQAHDKAVYQADNRFSPPREEGQLSRRQLAEREIKQLLSAAERVEYSVDRVKLLLRLEGLEEQFHLLLFSEQELQKSDAKVGKLHFSIEELLLDHESGEWQGREESKADLQRGLLRATNLERFMPLNGEAILQAVVTSALLDFDLEEQLLIAMKESYMKTAYSREAYAGTYKGESCRGFPTEKLSRKFLNRQLRKILSGLRPSRAFVYMDQIGMLEWFLPQLAAGKGLSQNRHHKYDIFYHSIYTCDYTPRSSLVLRLAGLLHDLGKVETRRVKADGEATFHNHEIISGRHAHNILRRFGFSKEISRQVSFLVRNHMFHYTTEWSDKAVRRFMRKVDSQSLEALILLRLADRKGSGKQQRLPHAIRELQNHITRMHVEAKKLKVTDLQINGHILMQIGIEPGPQMGHILQTLLAAVEAGRLANEYKILREEAKRMMETTKTTEETETTKTMKATKTIKTTEATEATRTMETTKVTEATRTTETTEATKMIATMERKHLL